MSRAGVGRGVEKSKNDLLTPAELLLLLGTSESTQACLVRMSSLHTRRGTAKDINVPTKWNKMNYLNRIAVTQAQGWLRLQLDNGCKFNSPTLPPSCTLPLSLTVSLPAQRLNAYCRAVRDKIDLCSA